MKSRMRPRIQSTSTAVRLRDDMLEELKSAAAVQGHSVGAEIKARIAAFKEEHRLMKVTTVHWIPKAKLDNQ